MLWQRLRGEERRTQKHEPDRQGLGSHWEVQADPGQDPILAGSARAEGVCRRAGDQVGPGDGQGTGAAAVPSTCWDLWASDVPLHTFLYFPHLQWQTRDSFLKERQLFVQKKKKKWESMSICHCWDCRFLVTLRFPLVTLSSKNSVQGNDRTGNDFLFASGKKCL